MTHPHSRGRIILQTEVPPETRLALKAIAKRDDLSVSQLVRRGIRHILALEDEAALPGEKEGGPQTDARDGAIYGTR